MPPTTYLSKPGYSTRLPTKDGSTTTSFPIAHPNHVYRAYVTRTKVTEMQELIEVTPVPARVADRLVRKIVHDWVFRSDERITGGVFQSPSSSGEYGNGTGGGNGGVRATNLRRTSSTDSSR
ncbi:unnamed protein product, partial [Ectocarpus sp. 13 AM-2016]